MNPDDIETVKANVAKLVAAGAPEQDIHDYIEAAGHPLGGAPAPVAAPPAPQAEPGFSMGTDISVPVARHILNAAQGIPGMEMLEAGAGALGSKFTKNPMSYQESLDALRGETGKIGGVGSAVEKIAGSALMLPFLPTNPAAAGALMGGADQALSADHPGDPANLGATATAAAFGGLLGKASDMVVAGGRGLLASSPAANLLERQTERAASAKRLYGAALAEGKTNPAGPEIRAWLKEPDIAEIVDQLKQTREFANATPQDPEMLDAIYKTLSDRAATIKKGLLSVSPNKPNIGRYQARDIQAAQAAGLAAMDKTMPTYREAVNDFAQHKAAEDAVSRGYEAVRGQTMKNLPSARNLTRTAPESFVKWAERAGPDETKAAVEGILGAVKSAGLRKALKTTRVAPSLLRAAGDATQQYLPRLGLLAAISSQ